MADGGAVKQYTDEMGEAAEEVVKDVKDEMGEMIEQGVQTALGKQLTPQQIQQKQLEDQKKLQEARGKIQWYKNLTAAQRKVREEEKQKQLQKQQIEEEEKRKKKMQEMQRKQSIPQPGKTGQMGMREEIARTRQEIGKGHGVGG